MLLNYTKLQDFYAPFTILKNKIIRKILMLLCLTSIIVLMFYISDSSYSIILYYIYNSINSIYYKYFISV